ncbi:anti-sigma factor family protein [Actinacidiphila bryophytorum]|uniref:Zinc-finger n=1 Tax=Actinacidiphila bryophytorum TaxID=1436133 RepID=A0A9W4H551_9ACTN|nr:zf-HC2 domain-containing protein [Actinacidiphila bryophytorum]MBM9437311.1 hypothetical protein [Actinacidiphila bryophytorum]MBN6541983.1 hypothetical protein [Actinacidiphila bryophytorum]CAG7651563.1 Putative zinc-finger [Actinacidiphila bryophytorum]
MTSTTGHGPHPDVMEIADLAEGILPSERAAEIRAHVESCGECGEVLASLQEIRGLLGELPDPEPMPADVAARIDAALAAETAGAAASPHVPRETSLPAPRGGAAADVSRGTSAPAGPPSAPAGRPSAPTGPGRGRGRRRALLFVAASAATALALTGTVYELASHSGSHRMNSDSSAERKASAQGGDSSPSVGDEVAQLLEGASGKTGNGGVTSPMLSPHGDTRVTGPGGTVITVPGCVLQATQRTQRPLAAGREPYQGLDSYLVVLPDPADPARVDAFVVSAACTADTPGRVLFQDSYPRS